VPTHPASRKALPARPPIRAHLVQSSRSSHSSRQAGPRPLPAHATTIPFGNASLPSHGSRGTQSTSPSKLKALPSRLRIQALSFRHPKAPPLQRLRSKPLPLKALGSFPLRVKALHPMSTRPHLPAAQRAPRAAPLGAGGQIILARTRACSRPGRARQGPLRTCPAAHWLRFRPELV
jgi:hypothetical protein